MAISLAESGPIRSADGCIRLTLADLRQQVFTHLLSGLDEYCVPAGAGHATPTAITGYTEWVGERSPVISLGWDWLFDVSAPRRALRRLGAPRSNLLLLDPDRADLSEAHSELQLEAFVDALLWQATVLRHVELRYRP